MALVTGLTAAAAGCGAGTGAAALEAGRLLLDSAEVDHTSLVLGARRVVVEGGGVLSRL